MAPPYLRLPSGGPPDTLGAPPATFSNNTSAENQQRFPLYFNPVAFGVVAHIYIKERRMERERESEREEG